MKTIIINESTADKLKLTEYKFDFYVRKFLKELLDDAVNAKPSDLLIVNGLDRKTLIRKLIDAGMLERDQRINDKDGDGNSKTATMTVRFRVPRKGFRKNMRKLFRSVNGSDERIDETDCGSVGGEGGFGYVAPAFGDKMSLSRPYGKICIGDKK